MNPTPAETLQSHARAPHGGSGAPHGGSGEMFDAIARRYDFLNRLLSLGIDQKWRMRATQALALGDGGRILDHATGTADLAICIARKHPRAQVVGLDPSPRMLEVAGRKVANLGLSERVTLELGHAEQVAFESQSFDGVSMAFGIRNVPDRLQALSEMARVTRPGGRVVILELSEPAGGWLGPLCRFHVHRFVPWLGGLLSGAREYRYLQESIAAFPPPLEFGRLMQQAGLKVLDIVPLTFGVCHLFVAEPAVTT